MADEAPKQHAPKGRIKALRDPLQPVDPTRCRATRRNGTQCGSRPIRGGTVCRMHGGGAPQVKAKAEERLAALVHPAITRLAELVAQQEFPSVAIAAVKDVLDRVHGKAAESVNLNHSGKVTLESLVAGSNE